MMVERTESYVDDWSIWADKNPNFEVRVQQEQQAQELMAGWDRRYGAAQDALEAQTRAMVAESLVGMRRPVERIGRRPVALWETYEMRWSERERVAREAARVMEEASAKLNGLDGELARQAVQDGLRALAAQMKALAETKYVSTEEACPTCGRSAIPFERIAKAQTQTARGIDDTYRLMAFAAGQPDSRPAGSLQDVMRYLTDEQFRTFQEWVREGMVREGR